MKYLLISLLTLLFVVGCGSQGYDHIVVNKQPTPIITKPLQKPIRKPTRTSIKKLPVAPKKKIKLKKVEDSNYADEYMYPEDTKAAKKDPVGKEISEAVTNAEMTKETCVAMIGQEKFDKYTTMFGSQAASIKRCTMLKAMNQ